ncbi:Alpha/beta hydrolase family protein [Novipirellula aureliae]|uniref:Alpha/beta hydrolase family protein n=1 Tax=Novipirellula aureliae TaxID=2527966 RepID=A0A5C6DRU5_9BACT|nr:alpha/beta hydrolase [Novipirellula aureliae]TWU37479.1 Alpha/beta hydrolase family protein [Novipirellula aureliae]
MKPLFVCILFALSPLLLLRADEPVPQATVVIELPIQGDRYDASRFTGLSKNERASESEAVWYPLTTKTRFALMLLKTQAVVTEYDISSTRLRIEFAEDKVNEIVPILFPPSFLNIDDFTGQDRVVVLVHGLEGGKLTYRELAPAFEAHGWFPLQMVYPNDGGIKEPAKFLQGELERLHRRYPQTRWAIVAHSLGGLVAWEALASAKSTPVTDLVTLGTPFAGSSMARFQSDLELADVAVRLMAFDLGAIDTLADGSGEAIELLKPDSQQRRDLLKRSLPPVVRLHLVAGSGGPIKKDEIVKFSGLIERVIERLNPSEQFAAHLRVLASASEVVEGVGDGAVTVRSATAIDHHYSQRVFSRSHTGLLKVNQDNDEVLEWILAQLRKVDAAGSKR